MHSRLARLAGMAGILLLVAACGGSAATAAPTAAGPTSTPASTEAPTDAQASDAPTDAATDGPAPSMPDLSSIFGSVDLLDSLDRYKISVEIAGASGTTVMDVTTIREPVVATKIDMTTAGQQISIVRIGDKAWLNQGGTGFIEVPAATVSTLTDVLAPEKLFASFENQDAFKYLTATGTEDEERGAGDALPRRRPDAPAAGQREHPAGRERRHLGLRGGLPRRAGDVRDQHRRRRVRAPSIR